MAEGPDIRRGESFDERTGAPDKGLVRLNPWLLRALVFNQTCGTFLVGLDPPSQGEMYRVSVALMAPSPVSENVSVSLPVAPSIWRATSVPLSPPRWR